MKIKYFAETDSLVIDMAGGTSAESREIAPNLVADFDDKGRLLGLEFIGKASEAFDLAELQVHGLSCPLVIESQPTT